MSLDRIKKVEQAYLLKKERTEKPDFNSFSDYDLNRYCDAVTTQIHRQEGIRSLDMAVTKLEYELMQGLITEREFEVLKWGEEDYWNRVEEAHKNKEAVK